jgi:hypothetical protein
LTSRPKRDQLPLFEAEVEFVKNEKDKAEEERIIDAAHD